MQIAILTNAGGPGVMAADELEANGLLPAVLGDGTRERLRQILAPAASVDNPVDMLASASPQQYAESLRLLLEDEGVDAVVVILPPPPMFSAGAVARRIIPVIQAGSKPVVVSLMGHDLVQEAQAFLRAVKIPTYTFPETAVGALGAVNSEQLAVNNGQGAVNSEQWAGGSDQRSMVRDLVREARGWLAQGVLFDILAAYGIKTPASRVVASAREAVVAAEEIGYPVVLKIAARGITHKSDVGGVRLNLRDAGEVAAAFERLREIAGEVVRGDTEDTVKAQRAQRGDFEFAVLVQRMVLAGQEVIVGVTRDAQFGPLLMFGSGGVEVEGLHDVAFALAPLDEREACCLLRETWAGRKLKGYRNMPAADETAVIDTILRLGRLAADFPELAEIEINPLIVLEDGALAVDGRARMG